MKMGFSKNGFLYYGDNEKSRDGNCGVQCNCKIIRNLQIMKFQDPSMKSGQKMCIFS